MVSSCEILVSFVACAMFCIGAVHRDKKRCTGLFHMKTDVNGGFQTGELSYRDHDYSYGDYGSTGETEEIWLPSGPVFYSMKLNVLESCMGIRVHVVSGLC